MEFYIQTPEYEPKDDYIRVATAMPEVTLADVETNMQCIAELYNQAAEQDVALVTFPELSITGYTVQDLLRRPQLLDDAKAGLAYAARLSAESNTAAVLGLPLQVGNGIYNCAALVADGEVKGVVPKQNLPNYGEFYEKRWFQTWDDRPNTTVSIGDEIVPFGRQQLFQIAGQPVGIEICEDLWVANQPSIELAAQGATIIINPSASPETVAKSSYRKQLVANTAARLATGYVYASADNSESTSDIVMSGHSIISEMGHTLAEQKALDAKPNRLLIADIDIQHINTERLRDTNYQNKFDIRPTPTRVNANQTDLRQHIDAYPFIPKGSELEIAERLSSILDIQAMGLARKLSTLPQPKTVLGLSGGLDSTLALLVAERAASILGIPARDVIHTLTMPGTASSDRTQTNAVKLAKSLGIPNEEIPIADLADDQLLALGHEGQQDITYENTQARLRQAFVFNKGNQIGALALGTGDMSEIALGWCTYNGDHMSGYNPNASIPKTLVRSLVAHAATTLDAEPRTIIEDILDTPVSPELTGNGNSISQKTEDVIGPYELHDFFMWHLLRWMEPERKIGFLALKAFDGKYTKEEVNHWLDVFMTKFYANQWKRQAMPDGAKVGIAQSPRGDQRIAPEVRRAPHDIRASSQLLQQAGVIL